MPTPARMAFRALTGPHGLAMPTDVWRGRRWWLAGAVLGPAVASMAGAWPMVGCPVHEWAPHGHRNR